VDKVSIEEGQAARRAIFEPFLEAEGITPAYLAKKLKEELESTEIKVFNDKENGIVYSKPLIAWDVRQRARVDSHKLRGDYPAEKLDLTTDKPILIISQPSNGGASGPKTGA
jgi:hypothetical protein